jgi:hypothetical protein
LLIVDRGPYFSKSMGTIDSASEMLHRRQVERVIAEGASSVVAAANKTAAVGKNLIVGYNLHIAAGIAKTEKATAVDIREGNIETASWDLSSIIDPRLSNYLAQIIGQADVAVGQIEGCIMHVEGRNCTSSSNLN